MLKNRNPLNKLYLTLLIASILFHSFSAAAQKADGWNLKKEEKSIKVYLKEVPGSKIKHLKFSTEVKATMSAVASLLLSHEHFDEWSYGSKNTKLLEKKSETEFFYSTEIEFPWPATDRDAVLHSKLTQNKKDGSLQQRIVSAPESMLPRSKDKVRVRYADLTYQAVPAGAGLIQINYLMKTDPGGTLPAWMINLAADEGPIKTMLKFKEKLKEAPFRNARLAFIAEPPND
jgi:hypothetical protein